MTWMVMGPHTISFKVTDDAKNFITKDDNGVWHANEKAGLPSNSPGQPEQDPNAPPPDENAPPVLIDAGIWDGEGFLSSGLILSFGDPMYQYKVTFSKAGTYTYVCIIHPGMGGSVKVGQ